MKEKLQQKENLDIFNIIPPKSVLAERDKVLQRAYKDLIFFGKAFLPNDFLNKSISPRFHFDIGRKLISTIPGQRICIILPRGFGKSILAKSAIIHKLCFSADDEQHFFAWVSEEQGQSIDHVKYIRSHFEENKMIKYYFGNMDGSSMGKRWTEKDLVTTHGDRIIAKGTSQRLRGRAEVDVRYTGIILDDFESELNTKTPERRADIKKWVVSTVYPALEETPGREGWIWLSGTIVHFDSFLQTTCDGYNKSKQNKTGYPWDVTFKRAIEDDKPLWKEQFPLSKLKQKKQEFIEAGLVNKFAQEYMNDARDVSSAAFKIDRVGNHNFDFKEKGKFTYLITKDEAIPVNVYIGVDLAATASETSDYQVIMVIAIDSEKNRYVLEYYRNRIPTFDMPIKIVEMAKKYNPVRRVTIETVAAQEMVRDMVERISFTERKLLPGIFKGVKPPHGINKQDRLETCLGPIVNSKKLFIRPEMDELIDELFEHPKPKNDDLMDGLYYADYFAKPPKSEKIDLSVFNSNKNTKTKTKKKNGFNWLTGSRG